MEDIVLSKNGVRSKERIQMRVLKIMKYMRNWVLQQSVLMNLLLKV
jgi:hypothetical protein